MSAIMKRYFGEKMFGETKIGLCKNGVEVNLKHFSEEKMH